MIAVARIAIVSLLAASSAVASGDGTFRSPFVIANAGRPGPATVHAGDLNADGKLDLITANGSPRILVYFQNPASRESWRQVPLPVGSQTWFVRSADFTGDGRDDIVASDISATAFFVESLPDEGFRPPVAISEARGARWTAIGDWNRDGALDLATANINAADLTVFLGDGRGNFTLSHRLPGSREHALEALDYDGDGVLDLFLGTGLDGIIPHQGKGDGTFEVKERFDHMGCTEYLAEVGHFEGGQYVLRGDLNGDGKGDLSPTCVETTSVSAGISLGDGRYTETLETLAGSDVDSSAFADLNGDGKADLAVVSKGSTSVLVHLGKGDGYFQPEPVVFGPTGDTPVFLIARDLDRDGLMDLVSADQVSSTLTLFWGSQGERFLESAVAVSGFGAARSLAAADINQDGTADLLLPRSDRPEVQVYLQPGKAALAAPSLTITTTNKLTLLEAADLDGDARPDLAGVDPISDNLVVALLEAGGSVRNEQVLTAGVSPSSVEVGRIDAGGSLDLAVPCKGSNHVAVFLGQAGGAFAAAKLVPTVDKPKGAAPGDWNGDAVTDLAVIADTAAVLQIGRGSAEFEAPVDVVRDAAKLYTDVAAGDIDGDRHLDLLLSEQRTLSVLLFRGNGAGQLEAPVSIKVNAAPTSLLVIDLNGDGRLDIATANASGRSASVLLNEDGLTFRSLVYGLGLTPVAHRVADFDGDGALDLAGSAATSAAILLGKAGVATLPHFRRGDVNGDGRIAINDPILILSRLFQGGEPPGCESAADGDDNGLLNISDPIAILGHLFLGTGPLPPPGPTDCGEDTVPDGLACSSACS